MDILIVLIAVLIAVAVLGTVFVAGQRRRRSGGVIAARPKRGTRR